MGTVPKGPYRLRRSLGLGVALAFIAVAGLGVSRPAQAGALTGCYFFNDTSTSPCTTIGVLQSPEASGWRSARIQNSRKVSVFFPSTFYLGLWRSPGPIKDYYWVSGGQSYTTPSDGQGVYQNLLYNMAVNGSDGTFTSSTIW